MNAEFARQQMIRQQVRAWDVYDHDILEVLAEVPRETFVPSGYESLAFADVEIPLAHGEMMMTPTIEGRVLQTLGLVGGENVLEIGTGSGFLTACLAKLAANVTSIDVHADFIESASANIAACGIENVNLAQMDGMLELPDETFDAIAVTGSIQSFDPRFVEALSIGGRMFIVVGDGPAMAAKLVIRTDDNDWHSETQFETSLAPLVNGSLPTQFLF